MKFRIPIRIISGIAGLAGIVAVTTGSYLYINSPYEHDEKDNPVYMKMERTIQNNRLDIKARVSNHVELIGAYDPKKEFPVYGDDFLTFQRRLYPNQNRISIEIPTNEAIIEGKKNTREYMLNGKHIHSTNGFGMEYYFSIDCFDRNGVKSIDVHEIDLNTKEILREIKVDRYFNPYFDAESHAKACFDAEGIGGAALLRVDVTDKKGNQYFSFIELPRKPFKRLPEPQNKL